MMSRCRVVYFSLSLLFVMHNSVINAQFRFPASDVAVERIAYPDLSILLEAEKQIKEKELYESAQIKEAPNGNGVVYWQGQEKFWQKQEERFRRDKQTVINELSLLKGRLTSNLSITEKNSIESQIRAKESRREALSRLETDAGVKGLNAWQQKIEAEQLKIKWEAERFRITHRVENLKKEYSEYSNPPIVVDSLIYRHDTLFVYNRNVANDSTTVITDCSIMIDNNDTFHKIDTVDFINYDSPTKFYIGHILKDQNCRVSVAYYLLSNNRKAISYLPFCKLHPRKHKSE